MNYKVLTFIVITCAFLSVQEIWADPFDSLETTEQTFSVSPDHPFQIRIDVTAGRVRIQKGDDSLNVLVSTEYIDEKIKKEINFDLEKNRLSIRLKAKSFHTMENDGETSPTLTVTLPCGVETECAVKLKAGEMDIAAGGLMLKELKVFQWAGELRIDFNEPNLITMSKADIRLKIGEMSITHLGNARFERANIHAGVGETQVDFSGALLEESKAKVDYNIGEGRISFQDSVGVRIAVNGSMSFLAHKDIDPGFDNEGRYYYTNGFDDSKVKLSVLISPGLGELKVDLE